MRILHVVASRQRRGAEVFAADLIAALDRDGLEQQVAVLHDGKAGVGFPAPTVVLGGGGPRLPGLRMALGPVRSLRGLLGAWKPDVVQAHGGEALKHALAAGGLGAHRPGRPALVYRRIGSLAGWLSSGPRKAVYGHLMRRADRVVTLAEVVRDETIQAFKLPPERVVTIPNGVDPRRVAPARGRAATRAELGIAGDALVVLSLGALAWEKQPLEHLAASAPLLAGSPGLVHLFAGDGPLRQELAAAVRQGSLEGRARLLGARADVGDLLAASDVLLFASLTEGMPAGVIEAGLAGLPVAGTATAGVPEVVEDGVTGLLVPPGDTAALRIALGRLLADPALRAAAGRAARERCRERFDITRVAAAYDALYRELVTAACLAS